MNSLSNLSKHETLADSIEKACQCAVPVPGHRALLNSISQVMPDYDFNLVLTRSGWHRTGGVVDRNGKHITQHFESWIRQESGGDLEYLLDSYLDAELYITRFQGQTHYLTACTGPRAQDFIQLEVEQLQEVYDRPLFDEENLPDSLEDLIEPLDSIHAVASEIGGPRYLFRRMTSIKDFVQKFSDRVEGQSAIERFMSDWDTSSASEHAIFSKHWVLALNEYVDAFDEPRFSVKPFPTCSSELPEINELPIPRGSRLGILIHDFDRKLGYPMAWFFFMLTHRAVSHQIAESIHQDLMGAYAYLPERDLKILIDWYDRPYNL